jgi:hypothetical protein
MENCPWYVPDSACEACAKACKEKVLPILFVVGLAGIVAGWLIKGD